LNSIRSDFYCELPLQRLQEGFRPRDGDFLRCAGGCLYLLSGKPKAFHHIANSGNGLDRNFRPECGSRVFTSNLDRFPKTVFVQLGGLDQPDLVAPKLGMFSKRRLTWNKPLNLPQFEEMPS
jgi:hypothetical protein